MQGVNVTLHPIEKAALIRLAEQEKRDPRSQAALIICRELERIGFLLQEDTNNATILEMENGRYD